MAVYKQFPRFLATFTFSKVRRMGCKWTHQIPIKVNRENIRNPSAQLLEILYQV